MAKELNFTQNSQGKWESSFVASGDRIGAHIKRDKPGPFIAYGSIEDVEATILHDFGPSAQDNLMFEIDVPADVNVTFVSYTEVTAAKITGV